MMFGLGINYLNGWAMAAAGGPKKERAEWPPHPDRIYMALSAAWFETDQNKQEKEALQWIEKLPPPSILASDHAIRGELKTSIPVTSYVPVNDKKRSNKIPDGYDLKKLKEAGLSIIPEHRSRQPRKFPLAIPHDPVVYLVWDDDLPQEHQAPLSSLCAKVISIGHPCSLVQMWFSQQPPQPNLIPVEGVASHRLRIFGPGRLAYLKTRCNRDEVIRYRDLTAGIEHYKSRTQEITAKKKNAGKGLKGAEKKQAEVPFRAELEIVKSAQRQLETEFETYQGRIPVTLRPESGLWQGYARPTESSPVSEPGSLFDERLVIMSITGKKLNLTSTLKLTAALRGALLSACPEPVPEWISGHQADAAPSTDSHVAFLPMPFVDSPHADGRLMGAALAIPRRIAPNKVGEVLEPWIRDDYGMTRQLRLFDGQWLECKIELETRETPPWTLRNAAWVSASRMWASVTPVVLDRHFDGKDKWERAAEVVKDACERIGLPRPENVLLHPVSLVAGVPHSRDFTAIRRKSDNGRMHHCHAVILFSEPVRGPVMVGAGRFRGYGLCRPMDPGRDNHD